MTALLHLVASLGFADGSAALLHLVASRASVRGMSRHRQKPVSEAQTRYAHLRALIDIRIAELIGALDRHEANRSNWQRADALATVDRKLSEALSNFEGRGVCATAAFVRQWQGGIVRPENDGRPSVSYGREGYAKRSIQSRFGS